MSSGWTFRGSAYCQLIRDVNKEKRLEWALQYKNDKVIYTDECTVQMESHRRFCCTATKTKVCNWFLILL